jgi:hypothetical protein
MYIVAIAWIYVVLMVSIMQPSWLRGVVTFVGAGVFPLTIVLYIMGSPRRRRDRARREAREAADASTQPSVEPDQ